MNRLFPRPRHIVAVILFASAACSSPASEPKIEYPVTTKGDVVTDYHGAKIADPYRWMEDLNAESVAAWVAAQNKVTSAYFETITLREPFRKRITELWNYPKTSIPEREGGRYFYSKNSGLERQAPVYFRASLTEKPTLAIDPNIISPDGSVSLGQWTASPNGKLIAYGLAEGGT